MKIVAWCLLYEIRKFEKFKQNLIQDPLSGSFVRDDRSGGGTREWRRVGEQIQVYLQYSITLELLYQTPEISYKKIYTSCISNSFNFNIKRYISKKFTRHYITNDFNIIYTILHDWTVFRDRSQCKFSGNHFQRIEELYYLNFQLSIDRLFILSLRESHKNWETS